MRLAVTVLFVLLASSTLGIENQIFSFTQENLSVQISNEGLSLIKQFEGFRSSPYFDSGGTPTIGFGTIVYPDGTKVTMQDSPITEQQALSYLQSNVDQKCESITNMIKVPVSQNQFDALCSFAYNLGVTALYHSTLLKLVNQSDFDAAAEQFSKWVFDNGVVVPGLEVRRKAEQNLFSGVTDVASN